MHLSPSLLLLLLYPFLSHFSPLTPLLLLLLSSNHYRISPPPPCAQPRPLTSPQPSWLMRSGIWKNGINPRATTHWNFKKPTTWNVCRVGQHRCVWLAGHYWRPVGRWIEGHAAAAPALAMRDVTILEQGGARRPRRTSQSSYSSQSSQLASPSSKSSNSCQKVITEDQGDSVNGPGEL